MSEKYDNIIILHGCPPSEQMITPKENRWMNWLESKLKEKSYTATAPDIPVSWNPTYSDWKKTFEHFQVTKNTLLVGHSCGGAFLVRWLLETKKKVKKLILVAPAKIPEFENDTRKDLYEFDLPKDGEYIADEIVIFTSNDFPHHMKSLEIYKESLKPKLRILENKFHFLYFQMKTNEFPELLDEILN